MAILPTVPSPVNQPLSPLQQDASNPKNDPSDTTTVKPLNATARGDGSRANADAASYGNSRQQSEGVNRAKTNDRGDVQSGLLSRSRDTKADGSAQRQDVGQAEAAKRTRGSDKSFEAAAAVVESVVKAELSQKVAKESPRVDVTPGQEARIKTEQFKATLSDVRKAEPRVANDNERPVALDTNASSESVGRYDKSA